MLIKSFGKELQMSVFRQMCLSFIRGQRPQGVRAGDLLIELCYIMVMIPIWCLDGINWWFNGHIDDYDELRIISGIFVIAVLMILSIAGIVYEYHHS